MSWFRLCLPSLPVCFIRNEFSEKIGDAFLLLNLLSLLYLCLFFICLLIHILLPSSTLFSSVPAVSQFDTGLGGIISNHQRIGPEVWDCICQRWQVNKWHVHLYVWLVFFSNHQITTCCIFVLCSFNHLQVRGVLQAVLQRDAVGGRAILGWGSAITTQQTLWDTRYLTAKSLLWDFKMSLQLSLKDRQHSN